MIYLKIQCWLGAETHAYNPALWEAKVGGRSQDQEFEISLTNMVKAHLY